jgi:hypothetical protein
MLSIISSGNRGCCSSTVPIREPPLLENGKEHFGNSYICKYVLERRLHRISKMIIALVYLLSAKVNTIIPAETLAFITVIFWFHRN